MKILFIQFFLIHSIVCFKQQAFESENPRDVCQSKSCLLDTLRFLENASGDEFVDPCNNFAEFTLGKLIKFRSLINLQEKVIFSFNSMTENQKRNRKILHESIADDDDEWREHKITKNFFQKCIDTSYIKSESLRDIERYLKDKSMALIDGAEWDPDKLNLTAILQSPLVNMEFLLNHKINRCSDPRDPESLIFCWRYSKVSELYQKNLLNRSNKTRMNFLQRFKAIDSLIKVDENLVNSSISHFLNYLEEKLSFENETQTPLIIRIKDISRTLTPTSNLTLNWLTIINRAFLEHSQAVSEDEEILIDDWKLFAQSLEMIDKTPVRIFVDVIFLAFLIRHEHSYMIPTPQIDLKSADILRFEQCLNILEINFAPATLSLFAKNFDAEKLEIKDFVKETLADILEQLENSDNLEGVIKDDVRRKFGKMKVIFGVNDELQNKSKMEEMYQELELSGDESVFEITTKLIQHNEKLNNEPKNSWFYTVNQLSHLKTIKYLPEIDLLFIPMEFNLHPYFDSSRPRYINTATLFTEIVIQINEGLKRYFLSEFRLRYDFKYDSIGVSFDNYQKWLLKSEDKFLPGFSLSNLQMFWIAYTNTYFMRYQNAMPYQLKETVNFQFDNFHYFIKSRAEFRLAFNCSELSAEEKILIEKFVLLFRN